MRKGMWEKVAKRSHKPSKIYSFGAESDEVMLYGTVDYELKDGRKTTVEWSARSHFAQEDGSLKMDFYQVYLVSYRATGSEERRVDRADKLNRILPPWPEQNEPPIFVLERAAMKVSSYVEYQPSGCLTVSCACESPFRAAQARCPGDPGLS